MTMYSVHFPIDKETEKAVYACVSTGFVWWEDKYRWLPKSQIEIEEFVQTINPVTNEPETYGKRVVKISGWLAKELSLR